MQKPGFWFCFVFLSMCRPHLSKLHQTNNRDKYYSNYTSNPVQKWVYSLCLIDKRYLERKYWWEIKIRILGENWGRLETQCVPQKRELGADTVKERDLCLSCCIWWHSCHILGLMARKGLMRKQGRKPFLSFPGQQERVVGSRRIPNLALSASPGVKQVPSQRSPLLPLLCTFTSSYPENNKI